MPLDHSGETNPNSPCASHRTVEERTIAAERPSALFLALEILEQVAASVAVSHGHLRHLDLERKIVFGKHRKQLEDLKVGVAMVTLVGDEVSELLHADLLERHGEWPEDPGVSPGTVAEHRGDQDEGVLWAIRQSLSLIEMFISTSAHPNRVARDLVDLRMRPLPADHFHLIRRTMEMVALISRKLLSFLSEREEAG